MLKYIPIALIRGYQILISPLLGSGKCRFQPSCSAYAIQAYKQHGVIKGTALTFSRIMRCHPFCTCGVDPVPQKYNHRQVKK